MFDNLKAEQARKNMTDQMVAEMLGISRPTYCNKRNNGTFSLGEVKALLDFFGCTFEYLFA